MTKRPHVMSQIHKLHKKLTTFKEENQKVNRQKK